MVRECHLGLDCARNKVGSGRVGRDVLLSVPISRCAMAKTYTSYRLNMTVRAYPVTVL